MRSFKHLTQNPKSPFIYKQNTEKCALKFRLDVGRVSESNQITTT